MHCFFEFDGNYESRLEFSKTTHEKVDKLISLQVLLLDEVSMMDDQVWECMTKTTRAAQGFCPGRDKYDSIRMVLRSGREGLLLMFSKACFIMRTGPLRGLQAIPASHG